MDIEYLEKIFLNIKELLENDNIIRNIYNANDNNKNYMHTIECFIQMEYSDFYTITESLVENTDYILKLKEESAIDFELRILNKIVNNNSISNFIMEIQKYEKMKGLLICVQNMLVLYSVSSYIEKAITSNEIERILNNQCSENKYYRGENNYKYNLTPSIYRHINGIQCFDQQVLYSLYNKAGLMNKYNDIFGNVSLDYDFLSYMQHSKSFSPFIDLTKNPIIALSFATNPNISYSNYLVNDASLYTFQFYKNYVDYTNEVNPMNIIVSRNKLRISSLIGSTLLCKCTYHNFMPIIKIFEDQTNDRMKYQRGVFLFINNSVFINGIPLIPKGLGRIIKYKIPQNSKKKIYDRIKEKYPQFTYENLMNPYLLFEQAPN